MNFIAGNEIPVSETVDGNLRLKIFKYRPREIGIYEVVLLLGEKHIGKSPYKVHFDRNIFKNAHII